MSGVLGYSGIFRRYFMDDRSVEGRFAAHRFFAGVLIRELQHAGYDMSRIYQSVQVASQVGARSPCEDTFTAGFYDEMSELLPCLDVESG